MPTKKVRIGLPWAVRRGIVMRYGRVAPSANRHPIFRNYPRRVAARMARLPTSLWDLPIRWRQFAGDLDFLAAVPPVERPLSKERETHGKIATSLRTAAQALGESGQPDPTFFGSLLMARDLAPNLFGPFGPNPRRRKAGAPLEWPDPADMGRARLSDFLRVMADLFEGERVRVMGLHRLDNRNDDGGVGFGGLPEFKQRVGADGAAAVAFERVSWFMRFHTKAPHNDLVREIVKVYHPNADPERDRSRSVRGKTGKKIGNS